MSARYDPRPNVLAYGAAKSLDIARTRAQACAQERMARRAARHGRPSSEVLDQVESVLRRNASAIGHQNRLRETRRVP
jgi:hypothetical protein